MNIGDKINRLTITAIRNTNKTFKTGKKRKIKEVLAKCECGTEKWFRYEHVKSGRSKSCGCLNYEAHTQDPTIKTIHYVMTYILSSAKKRELKMELTERDVRSIIFKNCVYCGEKPSNFGAKEQREFGKGMSPFNGVDRIDSQRGYVIGNVVACCSQCNTMKLDLTVEQFKEKVAKIHTKINTVFDENKSNKQTAKLFKYYEGLVVLNDYMGGDLSVANAARVSFNKQISEITDTDKKLISYLAEHKHMSPFRHVQFSIILQDVPEFVLRQLYKHQVGIAYTAGDFRESATVWNEVSGRYVEFDCDFFEPVSFRPQHESNKQASYKHRTVKNEDRARQIYKDSVKQSWDAYHNLLKEGVAKEQARMVIPLAFKTSVIWTASLEALAHFVKLRNHEGAQVETQALALIIEDIIRSVCPISSEALLKH